ncbi:MAG TPA: M15 family peptidase [Aliiroseovarius sp.]|nr:M15 family peptidase [Aliiroseovarius sp.]
MRIAIVYVLRAALMLLWLAGTPLQAEACHATNFVKVPISHKYTDPVLRALVTAYPGLKVSPNARKIAPDGQTWLALGKIRQISPEARLRAPPIREQFLYPYPLDFDLTARRKPFVDPGRLRNEAIFRALWFSSEAAARKSLARITQPGLLQGSFYMTRKHGVACQLQAALAQLARQNRDYSKYFRNTGGSFNWRTISSTSRLSTHSYGIAFDLNTKLAAYWRWDGVPPGHAGTFQNKLPSDLVETLEAFGFIWGGKWHHYDSMHFEYRPELILFARMRGG